MSTRPGIHRRLGWSAVVVSGWLAGCGPVQEVAAPARTPSPTATASDSTGSSSRSAAEQARPRGDTPAKGVVTGQEIDPKSVVDVVKEEVKGGESKEGPTPTNYLWDLPAATNDTEMSVEVPTGLQPLTANAVVPSSNPLTTAKFELGKQLYFDPRISLDGTVSCATCHNPEKGWTDRLPNSRGIKGQVGMRNAPTVLNTAYGRTMFWDGRAPSLEGQALGPPQNPIEMGDQSFKQIIERPRTIPGYQEQFKKVFGTEVTLDGAVKAIATFERAAALTGNSAYDRYDRGGDMKALTDSQKRGLVLFGLELSTEDDFRPGVTRGKAKCTACHVGFNFTDEQFHNLGVGWDANSKKFRDLGRFAVEPIGAKNPASIGAFKTPTVRDVEHTAPYMHDGSETTLEDVVEYYDRGGNPNPYLDKDIVKLNLAKQEKADLVAFLKALTGERPKLDLPTLPPGPDGKAPDPRAALTPPEAPRTGMLTDPHPGIVR
jgi:cytochrome c peroxidase